jgi:uncharacterized protein
MSDAASAHDGGFPDVTRATRIVLRPLANPLPLGFVALAVGSLLVAGLQLDWFAAAEGHQVALVLVAFVVPLQLVTSLIGFAARDAVAGTAMGILSGTWLSIALLTLTSAPGARSDVLGTLLVVAGVAMLLPASAAFGSKLIAFAVLCGAAARFFTAGLYQLTGGWAIKELTGLIGVALAAVAMYSALALLLEDARRRTLLPVGRRGRGAAALDGGLRAQLAGLEHEAGVREQL